jgi:selenocysteine lyase/cysteine desulfurase
MAFNRRNFIQKFSGAAGTFALGSLISPALANSIEDALKKVAHLSPEACAVDEEFWYQIKMAYTVSPTVLNLNNGGVSPQPKVVQNAVERYNQLSNEAPSYYMWRVLDMGREPLRAKLAELAGCSKEEIAIDRNSSEALETIIFGLKLKAGDEVVLTKQDYPNMINAWKQREKRDGIVLKWISFDFPVEDKELIVKKFEEAFTEKTKIVHVTHIINWCGQLQPAKEIAQAAHKRGIEVVLDAAHSFAHIDYNIPDLECDYFGTSLHKWLCAPFGSGMLYVKKEKIKNLYPLFAAPDPDLDDIRKFEHLGTRSFAIEQAIGQAVDFHNMIGSKRKEKRLHYLKNYWAEKVKDLPGVSFQTSLLPEFSGAICMFSIEGKTPQEIGQILMKKYKIHTVPIIKENISGVRVTPNVYTITKDLDRLVAAIEEMVEG